MSAPRIALLAPGHNLLDWAAARIVEQQRAALPDLSGTVVLLPSTIAIAALRERLLARAGGALLGPQLLTLAAYAGQHGESPPALSALDCKLQLAQALSAYLHLFPQQDATRLAEDFFTLFEDLSANLPELADDAPRFLARVARGYGIDLRLFSDEARTVHLLWRAWLTQSAGASPAATHAQRLASALRAESRTLFLVGFDHFSRAEAGALRQVLAREQVHLWLHGRRQGRDGATMNTLCRQLGIEPQIVIAESASWLDALLESGATLPRRIHGKPRPPGLRVQAADSPEHEAQMADLAIRQWLLHGKSRIAVISQDRRFARRLRALLDRAGVVLRDEAGWALSTSSAAAVLMHWLDCIEQDFHFRPLLALLRSHFHDPEGALGATVDGFERALYRSKTVSGLKQLRGVSEDAPVLLQALQSAAEALVLHAGPRPAQQWCAALLQGLQALPMWAHFPTDAAGRRLQELLQELQASLARAPLRLDWPGFRRLLQGLLEQATFTPGSAGPAAAVRLLTLEQAGLLSCDAVLLTGAAAGKFPAGSAAASLFNQSVRAELGLPHLQQAQELALSRFRRLLDAAPTVLITYAAEDEGETAQPCAWVELLRCADVADDPELAILAGSAAVTVARREPFALAVTAAPRPATQAALLPAQLSATAHQALVDCPYRFHAGSALGLRALQEPDEPYSRKDFGDSVHAVLSRFTAPVNAAQRADTEQRMAETATAVFAPDLRARALTRAWLAEFESLIPQIVDWLIQRRSDWPQAQAEAELSCRLQDGTELKGRIDRLEQNPAGGSSVVDYKTGVAPKKTDIECGEAVQATHYALAADNCSQVEYLQLKRDEFSSIAVSGDALAAAATGVRQRIIEVLRALHAGSAQPAQGDAQTCERCDYHGLCRKHAWVSAATGDGDGR